MSSIVNALTNPQVAAVLPAVIIALVVIIGLFGSAITALWAISRWAVNRVEEIVEHAIESRKMREIVKQEVQDAFGGAIGPIMVVTNGLAGKIDVVDAKAVAANRRVDENARELARHNERITKLEGTTT